MALTSEQKKRISNPDIINVGSVIAIKQADGRYKDAKGNYYNKDGKKLS